MPLSNSLIALCALLFGGYEIFMNFRSYRLNGFWFYWVAGLWVGLPFFLIAGLSLASPRFRSPVLEIAAGLLFLSGAAWKVYMKRQAKKQYTERWAIWEKRLNV